MPSADHAVQSTGWSCCVAALGRLVPLGCTSQQRTWLSHEPATSRLATGENARLETPSEGGDVTSKSLLGLCVGTGAAAPKAVPKADMASWRERARRESEREAQRERRERESTSLKKKRDQRVKQARRKNSFFVFLNLDLVFPLQSLSLTFSLFSTPEAKRKERHSPTSLRSLSKHTARKKQNTKEKEKGKRFAFTRKALRRSGFLRAASL